MTSEIRTNSFKSRAGLSTVTLTDSGPMFSGITTFVDNSTFSVGTGGTIHAPSTNTLNIGVNNTESLRIDSNSNLKVAGIVTATHFYGDGSNLTNINSTSATGDFSIADKIIHTGDTNTAIRFPAADTITAETGGNERLRINSSGQMGLGTNNPVQQAGRGLHINGTDQTRIKLTNSNSGATANDGFDIIQENDSEIHIINHENAAIKFGTNDAEKVRIDSSGNVNIGAKDYNTHSASIDSLQIGHALNLYEDSYSSGTDNYVVFANNLYYNSGNKYMRNDEASRIMMQGGAFYFQNAVAGTAGNAITLVDVLRITAGGSVGINETSPDNALHIKSTTDTQQIKLENTVSTGRAQIRYVNPQADWQQGIIGGTTEGDFITYTSAAKNYRVYTNNTERLRITSTGQLLLTSNTGFNPSSSLLSIATDASAAANMLSDSSTIYNHNNPAFVHVQNMYNTGDGQEAGIILHSKSSFGGAWAIYGKRTTSSFKSDLIFRGRSGSSSSAERLKIGSNGWEYHNTTYNGTTNGNVDKRYNWGSTNNLNFGMHCTTRNRYSIWEHRQIGRSSERTAQMSCGENGSNQGIVYIFSSTANADVTGGVNLANGATSWSATSDMRLKNKTGDILNALEDINKIEPLKFTWKYGPDNNPHVGVSAQSVENVVPEAIERGLDVERQREGDETEYMQVRYTELIPLSIAAIKELITKVETLEQENIALRVRVTNLEGN